MAVIRRTRPRKDEHTRLELVKLIRDNQWRTLEGKLDVYALINHFNLPVHREPLKHRGIAARLFKDPNDHPRIVVNTIGQDKNSRRHFALAALMHYLFKYSNRWGWSEKELLALEDMKGVDSDLHRLARELEMPKWCMPGYHEGDERRVAEVFGTTVEQARKRLCELSEV